MKVLMSLNSFANRCGYFYNAHFDPDATEFPNNGYNCRHPNQGEAYGGVGCCFGWSCPLSDAGEMFEADEEDCAQFGFEYEEGEYVIVYIPESEYNSKSMYLPVERGG